MKKFLLILAIAVAGYAGLAQYGGWLPHGGAATGNASEATSGTGSDAVLAGAFGNKTSNLQIEGKGTVAKILKDDTDGSRHQRFIVRLDSGQTLLVAHNIDLAPRIDALRVGDTLMFNGEYEWSAKGGVIHWTHRDPRGRHPAGWLKHEGRTYQ